MRSTTKMKAKTRYTRSKPVEEDAPPLTINEITTSQLSNLYQDTFVYKGITFASAENAINAIRFYREGNNGSESSILLELVKRIAMTKPMRSRDIANATRKSYERPDWEYKGSGNTIEKYSIRDRFMMEILLTKFSTNAEPLLATEDR